MQANETYYQIMLIYVKYTNKIIYIIPKVEIIMKCKLCEIEREDLTQHIIFEHNMSISNYKKQFNSTEIIDEKIRKNRINTRRKNFKFQCEICLKKIKTEKALNKHYMKKRDYEHSKKLFNDSNKDEWVECNVLIKNKNNEFVKCGLRRSRIDMHIKKDHKIEKDVYERQYHSPTLSKLFIERTTTAGSIKHEKENYLKDKNPFYQHTHTEESKLSISRTLLSKKNKKIATEIFLKQEDLLKNQKESINEIFDKIKNEKS